MRATARRGFTLVELMVVLAVSAIMLSIIAIPMIQGFNLTRTGQAFANAQATARAVRAQILGDMAEGAAIRYNATPEGGLNLDLPSGTVNFVGVKLDILLPAQGDPVRGLSGAFINPGTGMEDPTLSAPAGQINLPAAPGMSIVRYWIGLRSPLEDLDGDGEMENKPYNDPYSNLLMSRNVNRDNLFVLYRAEVQPLVFDGALGMYVPNTDFFADEDFDGQPDFDDPDFFRIDLDDEDGSGNLTAAGLEKVKRIVNWRTRGTILTAISRYDMIQAKFDLKTRRVYNDSRDGVVPLIRFQPKVVSQESVKGQSNLRVGEETHNPSKIGPEVYRTVYGLLSGAVVTVTPGTYFVPAGPGALSSGGFVRPPSGATYPLLEMVTRSAGGDEVWYSRASAFSAPVAIFDMGLYKELLRTGAPYPFTTALASADAVNTANGISGARTSAGHVDMHVVIVLDDEAGELLASFDIRDVGSETSGPYAFWQNRLPSDGIDPGVDTGPAETPNSDPDISAAGTPWG
ncbi:MAG: prepilin-type N-terminal cleavage/methylation domain-containing protein, partial [Armatimonadetes bacterium]|nr:prepilin-type N-terminal cleavage/methylation domain-containing protein [Armatimonadota bacterium]